MMKILLFLLVAKLVLIAEELGNDGRFNASKKMHPFVPTEKLVKPDGVRDNSFILELGDNPKKVLEINRKYDRYREALDGLYGIRVASYVKTIPMKSIIFFSPHHSFTNKIIFPIGYTIVLAESSTQFPDLKWDENILKFKTPKKFIMGNINVYLTNGNENITTAITLKKYIPEQSEPYYQVVKLVDRDNVRLSADIKDWDIIEKYIDLHGGLNFKKSGVVYINKQPYYIIEDKINGKIIYKGRYYRVSKSLKRG